MTERIKTVKVTSSIRFFIVRKNFLMNEYPTYTIFYEVLHNLKHLTVFSFIKIHGILLHILEYHNGIVCISSDKKTNSRKPPYEPEESEATSQYETLNMSTCSTKN